MQKFNRTLTLDSFTEKNLTLTSGTYTKAYEYTVPAKQGVTFGTGHIVNGVDNRGILFLEFKDSTPAVINGWVRLKLADANEVNSWVIMEERTERLNATKTDRQTAYFLEEYSRVAGEDAKLIIEIKPDSNATVVTANSSAQVPVTTYY